MKKTMLIAAILAGAYFFFGKKNTAEKQIVNTDKDSDQNTDGIFEETEFGPINQSLCISCGACEEVCPAGAIKIEDLARIDLSICTYCETCVSECPTLAISFT